MQAEKRGLITSAANLIEIRDMLNTLAHEYEFNDLSEMVVFVFRHYSFLTEALKNAKQYSSRLY